MKACVLEAVNRLVYKDVPTPVAGEGEVLIRIKASGLCSSDFTRVFKSGTYHFPTIPGHEFSGVIEAVGAGVSDDLVGKRAVVYPLLPCRECEQCRNENYSLCANYNYFGSRCDGGFAELIAVPVWNMQVFDESIPYTVAALTEPAAVAWHAVAMACIQPGECVCISGSGTIAILCGIWAAKRGAKVIFAVRNQKKKEFIQSFDAFYTVPMNEYTKDAIADINPLGADVLLECVGTPDSVKNCMEWVKTRGRVILVGNPSGDIDLPQKLYWKILRSEISLTGVWNSVYPGEWQQVLQDFPEMGSTLAKLITHTFPLSEAQLAFEKLSGGNEFLIKGMYTNE